MKKGLRVRREGSTTVAELNAEGLEALEELARRLPNGIPLNPEALLARIHRRNKAGFHLVLGQLVLPNTLAELYRRLPETVQVRGIRYTIPGLHRLLEGMARENEAILLRMMEELRGSYTLPGSPQGPKA